MSRSIKVSLVLAVLAVVLIPVVAVASHQFTDVPDSNIFHDDIAWMADNNVTKGCNPPANDKYCPSNTVTREQMAAFMHRLAVNQVVDAATAQVADHATTAGDAETLDGKTPAEVIAAASPVVATASGNGFDNSGWNTADLNDKTEVLTVTLDALVDGIIVVTGFGQIGRTHVNGEIDNIVFDVTDDFNAFGVFSGALSRIPVEAPSGGYISTATPQRIFSVIAGTHTFTLVAARPESAVAASVSGVNLVAVFYPDS